MRFCLEEMRIGFSMLRFERAVCAPLLLLLLLLLSYVMWMNEKNTRKTHKHCEERSRCVELIQFYNYNATERTYNRNESERECPERPECMNDVGLLTRSAHITFCRLLTCLLCTLRLHIAWQCALNREWVRYKMPKPRADSKCVCVSLCMFEWVGKRVSACIPWYWAFGIAEVYGELLLWVLRKLPNHMNSNRIIVITQQRWNEMKSTYYNAVDYEDSSKCYYSQRIDWNRREIMFAVNGEKTHTQRKMCELRMRHALAG